MEFSAFTIDNLNIIGAYIQETVLEIKYLHRILHWNKLIKA